MNRKIFFVILGTLLLPGIGILSKPSTKRDYLSPCEPYYHLKNGYDLYSEIINDSILRFILRKDDLKRVISSEPYLTGTNEKYNLHYNNRDFNDYVALTRSEGNYIRIVHLYQKSSGKNLFAKGKRLTNYYYTGFSIKDVTRDCVTIAYTDEETVVHTFKRSSKRNRLIIK